MTTYTPAEIQAYFAANPDQATPEGIAAASAAYGVPIADIGAAYGLTPQETQAWMAVSTNQIGASDNQLAPSTSTPDPAPQVTIADQNQADNDARAAATNAAAQAYADAHTPAAVQDYAQAHATNYIDAVIWESQGDMTKIAETLARLNVTEQTIVDAYARMYPDANMHQILAEYRAAPSASNVDINQGINARVPIASQGTLDAPFIFSETLTEQTMTTSLPDATFANASPADVLRIAAANNVTVSDVGAQFGLTPTQTAQWMAVPTNRIGSPNNQLASLASVATNAIVNAISSVIPSSSVNTVIQALTDIGKTDTTTSPPAAPGLWETIKSNPAMLLTAAFLAWKLIR